jgi:hypothetical protein
MSQGYIRKKSPGIVTPVPAVFVVGNLEGVGASSLASVWYWMEFEGHTVGGASFTGL